MMRTFIIVVLFFPFLSPAFAQSVDKKFQYASNSLKGNARLVQKYSFPNSEKGRNVLRLEVPFSNANFISPTMAYDAKGKVIEKVQLIYTTFKESPSFDQQKLNQERLRNLQSLLPDAFLNPMTEWELIGQTGAQTPEEGKNYFHGFVITWRSEASTELKETEITSLDSIFKSKLKLEESTGKPHPKDPLTTKKYLTNVDGSKTEIDRNISEDSLWMYIKSSDEHFSVVYAKWGDTAHSTVIVTEMSGDGFKRKRTWKLEDHLSDGPRSGMSDIDLHNPDSVVTTVLRRNSWTNMILVSDVTGSMSPYTAQVLAWVPSGLSGGRCAGFVFFNDGDDKSTNQKNVGKTGGIYSIKTQSFDSVFMTMKRTMREGDGGDLPENPLEAVIYSINKFPTGSEIILIADNFSSPRDLELFEKINRPVHIVLCGARGTVNPDYLFLARQTNGTVHTVHNDITNLSAMKDGEIVEIEGKHYLLHDEHFICTEAFSPVIR